MLSIDNGGTRDRSLAAAIDVVRHDGIHALTTRAIARRSGLTQPAIYRHFSGKEELVAEVLGEIRSRFLDRLHEAGAEGSSRERLISSLEAFRDFAIEEPRLYDALFLQTEDAAQPAPAAKARGGTIFGFLVERVTDCGREGVVRNVSPVASALSLAAHVQGLVLLYRQGRFATNERFSAFFRSSLEELLRGLNENRT